MAAVRELQHRLAQVEKAIERLDGRCDDAGQKLTRLDEQVSGERGLTKAMLALAEEIAGLRKMGWAIVVVIVGAVLAFAFGGGVP